MTRNIYRFLAIAFCLALSLSGCWDEIAIATGGSSTNTNATVDSLRRDLVAEYLFSGNVNDTGPNHLHATVSGAALTADRNNKSNSAYYFDGTSYIEVEDTSVLDFNNNFTLSAWVKLSAFKAYGCRIIDKCIGSQGDGFLLDTYNPNFLGNRVRMMVGGNGWDFLSTTDLQLNQWYYVVTTYNNGVGKIYIDGVLNLTNTSNATSIIVSSTPMRFGFDTGVRTGPDFDDSMVGSIDDIRIYKRALTDDEIMSLFHPSSNL